MIPLASFDESPSNVSSVSHTALSRSLWVARPWPSKSFKRMAPTAVPQDPITCALLDEWHQQLFMRHELRSNLTSAVAPCFSDVCGYSCKDVQTPRLTVRSCSPLHCHCLTEAHTRQKKQSSILGFWTKVLEIAAPKTHPWVHRYIFEGVHGSVLDEGGPGIEGEVKVNLQDISVALAI